LCYASDIISHFCASIETEIVNQPSASSPLDVILGFVGAAVGAAVGVLLFDWIRQQGFYAMILPGALMGFGFTMLSRHRHVVTAIACAVLAILVSLHTEWRHFPFRVDNSLGYFITHVHQIRPIGLIMIAIGGLLAFFAVAGSSLARRE